MFYSIKGTLVEYKREFINLTKQIYKPCIMHNNLSGAES